MPTRRWDIGIALTLLQQAGIAASDEAQTTKVKVGERAPNFNCQTLFGEEFNLAKQKGKVVAVNFLTGAS